MASAPSNKTPTEPVQPQPRKLRYEEPKIGSVLPQESPHALRRPLPSPFCSTVCIGQGLARAAKVRVQLCLTLRSSSCRNPSASTVRRLMWDLKQV